MARYVYQDWVRDGNGRVVPSATITPYEAGTTTAVTVYAAATGGTAVNSVTASATTGYFIFYVDSSEYASTQKFDITISATGYTSVTLEDVLIVRNAA